MNNRYFKGALIAAVAATCGYASASTIAVIASSGDAAGKNVSAEGAKLGGTTVLGSDNALSFSVSVTTAVSHFPGDAFRLTLGSNGTWASAGASSVSVACESGNIVLDTIPSYSADGKTLTWSIATTSGATAAKECIFSSLAVHGPSVVAGIVTVDFAAKERSATAFERDVTTGAKTAFSVASQLGSVTVGSTFNGVVDYQGSAGKGFETDDGTGLLGGKEDALVIKFATAADNTSFSLTGAASVSIVLNAESGKKFSFLDVNGDGACSTSEFTSTASGLVGASGAGLAVFTIGATCSSVTFTSSTFSVPGAVAGDISATVAMGSRFATPSVGTIGATITPMDFGSNTTANLNKGSVTLASTTTLDAGQWTSNGSTVTIPYMPVNTVAASRIAPVVYITNRSLVSGPATASMRNESGVLCEASLGTIEANRTTNVSSLINDAVKTCYNTSSAAEAAGHRLSITITASLPSADTEVYSAFTVGGTSRVSVVNSSNGAK